MGGSYPVAFGSRGSCSVHAKMKERFSKRTKVRAMLCKGVPSCQCHGAIAVITHPYPNDLNLWTHRSRKRQKPRLLWEQPTSHHQKTHNGEKFLKNGKTPKICAKFPWHTTDSAGTRVSFRPPSNVSAPAHTTRGARYWEPSAPWSAWSRGCGLDLVPRAEVICCSIQGRYSGWSTHLLRWFSYVKLGRSTYSNTFLRLSSGTEIGAMVLRAVRTSAQRDSTYEAQQYEKIPQQKINCSLLGWCPPCSLKLVCFMFTEKVIYAGWLIGIPLTNCDNPYYN